MIYQTFRLASMPNDSIPPIYNSSSADSNEPGNRRTPLQLGQAGDSGSTRGYSGAEHPGEPAPISGEPAEGGGHAGNDQQISRGDQQEHLSDGSARAPASDSNQPYFRSSKYAASLIMFDRVFCEAVQRLEALAAEPVIGVPIKPEPGPKGWLKDFIQGILGKANPF